MRIDIHLTKKHSQYSRAHLQKLIKSGAVLVNNKIVKPHYEIRSNDKITEKITPPEKINLKPDKSIKLDIIYEDKNYLVINKPAGLVVHPSESVKSHTLVNALLAHCPSIKNIGDKKNNSNYQLLIINYRPGIVHRLDKDVSGLMVIAKTEPAFNDLKKQFKNHAIKKEYTALAHGIVKNDEGEINLAIGRSSKGFKMSARSQPKETDKKAITKYKVIKRLTRQFVGGDYTLLKVQTITGRTHQIRVHLRAIGHPIIGDQIYQSKKLTRQLIGGNKINIPSSFHQFIGGVYRLFLHADLLEFKTLDNQIKKFKLDLPEELKNILNKLNEK